MYLNLQIEFTAEHGKMPAQTTEVTMVLLPEDANGTEEDIIKIWTPAMFVMARNFLAYHKMLRDRMPQSPESTSPESPSQCQSAHKAG